MARKAGTFLERGEDIKFRTERKGLLWCIVISNKVVFPFE